MDRTMLYDLIYALTAKDGREKLLFGDCGAAAREAFRRSLAGEAFPELWLEIPLAGDPWLDFHALTSYEDVADTNATFAGHDGAYTDALMWFARQAPGTVRQLALSYDTHAGDIDNPAVQLLVNGPDETVSLAFLEAVGRPDLHDAYRGFRRLMPQEWYACYVGVFPGREVGRDRPWVRVECIVNEKCQQSYAGNAATLREHLAGVGMREVDDDLISRVCGLARSPFPLELQFDVGTQGTVLPVLSASVRFQARDWGSDERRAPIYDIAGWLQEQGLADNRCALLAQTAFAKRVGHGDGTTKIHCFPAFVKLRWREGLPLDAKAYLQAQAW